MAYKITYNKLNLTLTSILVIALFFTIPEYNSWFFNNILNPNANIAFQSAHLKEEDRMLSRFGSPYVVYKETADYFKKENIKDAILLLPPNDYLKSQNVTDFISPEPSEFYYFTGVKAVWANSPGAEKANWAIVTSNNTVLLTKIKSPQQLTELLATYKQYKLTL